jgi:hypothetical protein
MEPGHTRYMWDFRHNGAAWHLQMAVPAEVLAAALAEDAGSRRSRPLALSQTIS